MKCPECDEKFVDYLYKELPPEERLRMDEHFASCESCRKQLAQLQFVRTSFQCLQRKEPRSLVHQRILAHAKESATQKQGSWLTSFLLKPAALTVMVLLIATGLFYYAQQSTTVNTGTVPVISQGTPETAPLPPDSQLRLVSRQGFPSARLSEGQSETVRPLTQALMDERGAQLMPSIQTSDALSAFELGNFYFSKRDFEKAIASYSIALTMNPKEASIIRYQLALCFKQLNDCNNAVQVLDDIQKRFPDYRDMDQVFMLAGDCYLDLEAYDKAETTYTDLITKFPDKKPEVEEKLETARKFRRVNLAY